MNVLLRTSPGIFGGRPERDATAGLGKTRLADAIFYKQQLFIQLLFYFFLAFARTRMRYSCAVCRTKQVQAGRRPATRYMNSWAIHVHACFFSAASSLQNWRPAMQMLPAAASLLELQAGDRFQHRTDTRQVVGMVGGGLNLHIAMGFELTCCGMW